MRFLVHESEVSHFPLLRNRVCCQSWCGSWALHGCKVPMQVSPSLDTSPGCVLDPLSFLWHLTWPFPNYPCSYSPARPFPSANLCLFSWDLSCVLFEAHRRSTESSYIVYGVNTTGGAQFVNKEAKANSPVIHHSNISYFSLKCLFELRSYMYWTTKVFQSWLLYIFFSFKSLNFSFAILSEIFG